MTHDSEMTSVGTVHRVQGRKVAHQTIAVLREIVSHGESIEQRAEAAIRRFAAEEGADIAPGTVKGEWVYRIDALAFKMPDGFIPDDADEEESARLRDEWVRGLQGADFSRYPYLDVATP